ncbi:MAG: 50S ribosomal protein L29 [Bacteroidota bacterium]
MKQQDIILLSDQELKEKIEAEKNKLIKLKLQHAISPIENPMEIRKTRKNIARLLTEFNKRKNNNKITK